MTNKNPWAWENLEGLISPDLKSYSANSVAAQLGKATKTQYSFEPSRVSEMLGLDMRNKDAMSSAGLDMTAITGETLKDVGIRNTRMSTSLGYGQEFGAAIVGASISNSFAAKLEEQRSQQLAQLKRMTSIDTRGLTSAIDTINKINQQASKNLAGIQEALQLIDWDGIETAVNRTIETASQLNVQDVSEFVDIVREQPEMAAAQKAAQENPAVMEQLYAFLSQLWMITKVAGASEEATGLLVFMALAASYMQAGIPGVVSTAYGMALPRIALKQQELQDKLNNRERDV